jgi:polyferredoxin
LHHSILQCGKVTLQQVFSQISVNQPIAVATCNPIAIKLSDGSVRNGYTIKLLNMVPEPRLISLRLVGLDNASMAIDSIDDIKGQIANIQVDPDKLRALRVFISVPPQQLKSGRTPFQIIVKDQQSFETDSYNAEFEVPEDMK